MLTQTKPASVAAAIGRETKRFNDMLVERLLIKRASKLVQWRHMAGYSTPGLAGRLHPAPHRNTIFNWERGGKIPHTYLKQLVALGFPEKDANYGL